MFSLWLFFFFSDCHTRFMPPVWPQRETEISSWFHFVRLIFLSLWPWQPVTVRRLCVHRHRTQTHILCVLVTCAQKMSLSTSRETDRGGAVGLLGGGVREGEDVKCWLVVLWKAWSCVFKLSTENGQGLTSIAVKCWTADSMFEVKRAVLVKLRWRLEDKWSGKTKKEKKFSLDFMSDLLQLILLPLEDWDVFFHSYTCFKGFLSILLHLSRLIGRLRDGRWCGR